VSFATAEEGEQQLASVDDFVSRLSPFDRSARMKTSQAVSQEEFVTFMRAQALDWPEESKVKVHEALKLLETGFAQLNLPQVSSVILIRTTGLEEGDAAYTRGRSIILPDSHVRAETGKLASLLAHELFHVISRSDIEFRDRLYRMIGFEKCPEIILPSELASQRITNPDAPAWEHAISIRVEGRPHKVVPILLSSVKRYPEGGTDAFFQFLTLRFWPIERESQPDPQLPVLFSLNQLEGFHEQVGRNTGYIIHPEEILADNFKLLVTGVRAVQSPVVLEKLKAAMMENR